MNQSTGRYLSFKKHLVLLIGCLTAGLCSAEPTGPESIPLPNCGGLFDCGGKATTVEIERCYDSCAQEADALMNRVYKNGLKSLDAAAAAKLRQSQRAWIEDRDNFLGAVALQNKDSGTMGGVVYGNFKATFIRTRLWLLVESFRRLADPVSGIPDWLLQK